MAKNPRTTSKSKKEAAPQPTNFSEANDGARMLTSELASLGKQLATLNQTFSTFAKGQVDAAKVTAGIISDYGDLNDSVNSIYSLQEKIVEQRKTDLNNLKLHIKGNESMQNSLGRVLQLSTLNEGVINDTGKFAEDIVKKLESENALIGVQLDQREQINTAVKEYLDKRNQAVQADKALASISKSQILDAQILADFADSENKRILQKFVKEKGLEDLTDKQIQIKFRQHEIEQQINSIQNSSLEVKDELLHALKEEQTRLESIVNTQTIIEERLKAQAKEAKKKQIEENAAKNIHEKITELMGDQFGELEHIGHAIKDSMVSPLALVGALLGSALEEFGKLGKESRAFLDTSKLTVDQTEHIRHYAHDLSLEYRAQGVEMKDVLDSTNALVGQFGSLNRVSDGAVEKATLLGKAFGISADNAAGVIAQLQRSAGVSAETAGNIAALGANFAKAAGVAPDAVMQDIATSSNEIAKYFKGTPKDLFKTAVEARRLGLDLKKVANISQNLLNFESSIEDQMTASVLLGREINLDKARQLAMEGKIQEAAEETLKQVGSLSDFNRLNAVQKEAVAKAAGMEVGDLQKSLEAQEAIKNMTSAQRAEYEKGLKALNQGNESAADRLLKEQRNQLTQEKIADAVAKISDIFANVLLPVLEPIFDIITGIFNIIEPILPLLKTGLQIFLGWKAVSFLLNTQFFKTRGLLGSLAAPFQFVGKSLKSAAESSLNWIKSLKDGENTSKSLGDKLKSVKDTIKSFFMGKGFKAWGTEGEEAFSKTTKGAKGFFNKFSEWVNKFSFDPLEEAGIDVMDGVTDHITGAAEDATQGVADAAKSKSQKIVEEKAGGAVETLQGKAEEKITSLVEGKKEDAVETLQGKAEEKGGEMIESVTGKADEASKVESTVKASPGEGIKTFLENLSAGLKSMGEGGVLKGAINLIPASIGLLAMVPGFLGAKLLEKINGKKLGEGLYELAFGLLSMSNASVAKGALNLMLAGAGFVVMSAGIIALGVIAAIGVAIGTGLTAIAGGLTAFAAAGPGAVVLNGIALSLGASLLMMGAGLFFAANGFASLAEQFKEMTPEQILATSAAFISLGIAINIMAGAGAAATAGVLGLAAIAGVILATAYALQIAAPAFTSIAEGIKLVVESINQLKVDVLSALSGAFFSMALALGALTAAIVTTAVLAPAATALALLLGTLGASAVLVGIGLKLAEGAIASITNSLINLVTNVSGDALKSMTDGLFSLAGGIGTLALASVGFLIAIPAVAALTVALGALGPVLMILGMGVQSVATGFQSLVASINQLNPEILSAMSSAFFNMSIALGALTIAIITTAALAPATLILAGLLATLGTSAIMVGIGLQMAEGAIASITDSLINLVTTVSPEVLSAMKTGLFDLAMGIGSLSLAALAIYPAIPALAIFTGAMALLGPVLKVVGEGVNYISVGFQNLANAVKQINPETMWSIAAAFGSVALALGALSVAIVTTAIFAPAAILLAGVMTTLGISAIMVGVGLKLASSAIESITNSLLTLTSNISPSTLDAMKSGLFSLAEGIGAVGLAAIGFTMAIPSVTLFSLLMGTLGFNLISVGTGMVSITSNLNSFITSVNTLLPMLDQINLLTVAFSDLAASIGEVGIASLLAFPAMMALSGITSMLGGLFGEEEKSVEAVASTPATVTSTVSPATTTTGTPAVTPTETPAIDIEGLMTKLDSLISAVNSQPIQLVVNGKILAEVVGRNTTRSGAVGK